MIRIEEQRAINQIYEIISLADDELRDNLPQKMIDYFKTMYNPSIEYNHVVSGIPLKEQGLERETIGILTYITNTYLKKLT